MYGLQFDKRHLYLIWWGSVILCDAKSLPYECVSTLQIWSIPAFVLVFGCHYLWDVHRSVLFGIRMVLVPTSTMQPNIHTHKLSCQKKIWADVINVKTRLQYIQTNKMSVYFSYQHTWNESIILFIWSHAKWMFGKAAMNWQHVTTKHKLQISMWFTLIHIKQCDTFDWRFIQ